MEIRKVQITGGSSFTISLPKTWIDSLKIKKNDPLGIIIRQDGTLIISPFIAREKNQSVKTFETDAKTEEDLVFRSLIGAYIAGYKVIKVVSKVEIPARIRRAIKEFCQITIGPEVIEETANLVITKDLLNPSEMPFDKTIQRMHIIIKNMYRDVITAFVEKDPVLAENIITNDNEVDRLHWLVMRQANLISHDIKVAEKMGETLWSASHYTMISKLFERIADHTCRIARKVIDLADEKIDQSAITDEIVNVSDIAINILTDGVDAFFEQNIESSNDNIKKGKDLIGRCEKIMNQILAKRGSVALPLSGIVESILRIGEYSTDLSEYVIDYLIGEETK